MSSETVNPTAIPDEDALNVQTGSKSWRFANGKIVQGQEIEKDVEVDGQICKVKTGKYPSEKAFVGGVLRRVGIYKNPSGKYGPEHKLEADIETKHGLEHYSCSLLGSQGEFKVGIAAITFAWSLTQFGKDDAIGLGTAQGEPVTLPNGQKGGRPTYVNAYRIEGKNATPIYRPRRDKDAPRQEMADQWAELLPKIIGHPAYAERPITEETQGGPTHLTELIKECEARGWPSPSQQPQAWLNRLAEANKHPVRAKLTDYDDDVWGQVRQGMAALPECPPWLKPSAPAPTQNVLI